MAPDDACRMFVNSKLLSMRENDIIHFRLNEFLKRHRVLHLFEKLLTKTKYESKI